jgi:hypothetical protein
MSIAHAKVRCRAKTTPDRKKSASLPVDPQAWNTSSMICATVALTTIQPSLPQPARASMIVRRVHQARVAVLALEDVQNLRRRLLASFRFWPSSLSSPSRSGPSRVCRSLRTVRLRSSPRSLAQCLFFVRQRESWPADVAGLGRCPFSRLYSSIRAPTSCSWPLWGLLSAA